MLVYSNEELKLMEGLEEVPKKQCKNCKKMFPVHRFFFNKEKRIKDGFENSCRMCRFGKFVSSKESIRRNAVNPLIRDKYNNIYEMYDHYLDKAELPYRSFILDNHIELFRYALKKDNKDLSKLNELNRDWFKKYSLYSPLLKKYQGIIYDYVNAAYPDKYLPWDFITVGGNYWRVEDNRINAIKWLIDQCLKDEVIEYIEDIPKKITNSTFTKYGLSTLLNKYYGHVYNAINLIYPDKFNMWQYGTSEENYYNIKQNRIDSLKHFIEYIKLDIKDIHKVLSYEYLNNDYLERYTYKLKLNIDKYYNSLYEYINEAYPNVFNERQLPYKNSYLTLDNIIVKSDPERVIHHLFMWNKLMYEYGTHKHKITTDSINVVPDWIICHEDKIVFVEYYGMYNMKNLETGYDSKKDKKDKIYNELCMMNNKYVYVDLYRDDLNNKFAGLVRKMDDIGINIDVNKMKY